jgi:hypothetical protein
MGKVKKKKLSVKSGRHEFSLSSLTMYGQSEEKQNISVKSGRHEFSLSSLMGKVKKIKKKYQ